MKEVWLQLNGKYYDYKQLQQGKFAGDLTGFEKATLDFCHQWISGQSSFTVSTSGSTGEPKPFVHSRSAMVTSAQLTEAALGLRAGDHAMLCLDTRFIAGKMMLVRSFVTGMHIIAVEPSANPFDKVPADMRIDFVAVVPYQLESILESTGGIDRLNHLKSVLVGGAAPNKKLTELLRRVTSPVYATYGMTETVSHIALQRLNGPQPQDCFHVLPGISISQDERGCLVLEVAHLQPSRIITNDLVELLSPHQFQWLGRFDNVINSGGIKVIPEKVEKQTENIFGALRIDNRFFVAGVPDERLGSKVVLIIEGPPFPGEQQQNILSALAKVLNKFEVPKEIRFVGVFVETESQKIDRRATTAKQ